MSLVSGLSNLPESVGGNTAGDAASASVTTATAPMADGEPTAADAMGTATAIDLNNPSSLLQVLAKSNESGAQPQMFAGLPFASNNSSAITLQQATATTSNANIPIAGQTVASDDFNLASVSFFYCFISFYYI